tara:strand:- start:30510 stop:30743 length:234 start_codon:yes stop_codon:yes gene_type:complete
MKLVTFACNALERKMTRWSMKMIEIKIILTLLVIIPITILLGRSCKEYSFWSYVWAFVFGLSFFLLPVIAILAIWRA